MSRSERSKQPVVHKEISVNINDWMQSRQQVFNPNDGFHAGVVRRDITPQELMEEAERRQEAWLEAERQRQLEGKLETTAVSCGECGKEERPYLNDYLCYRCRDKLDS